MDKGKDSLGYLIYNSTLKFLAERTLRTDHSEEGWREEFKGQKLRWFPGKAALEGC